MSYFGSKEWYTEIVKGNVAGHSIVHKYGRMPSGAINTEEAICADGVMNFLSAATPLRIKAGGNANDTAAGTGAREITIEGVDGSGSPVSEAVATNGSAVSLVTSASYFRNFRSYVSSTGSYVTTGVATTGQNQANIVIENSDGGTDLIQISQYEGQTQYAGYSVPYGKDVYLVSAKITVDSLKNTDVILYTRANYLDTSVPVQPRRLKLFLDGVAGEFHYHPNAPMSLGNQCDIWWTSTPTANATETSVDFELLLVDQ